MAACSAEAPPPTDSTTESDADEPPIASGIATSAPAGTPPPELSCRTWKAVDGGTNASFRGLSAVDHNVVWVSGTGGTWGRTTDGGATWAMNTVPGAEELDFRDVDAFDADVAYLMSAGPGDLSRIYKTIDGGVTWILQFTQSWPEGFFDGMAFWDVDQGLVYGDPVGGRFTVVSTEDGGTNWIRIPDDGIPEALEGEAGFAASGTGLAVLPGGHAWFGTGGSAARVFRSQDYGQSWSVAETPMAAGESSTGIFSLAFSDPQNGVAVGGDYAQPESTAGNAAVTSDGGATWSAVTESPPAGYRSAVAMVPGSGGKLFVALGTSGSDFSSDGGRAWQALATGNYNALGISGSCASWAAGPGGQLAQLAE